MGYKLLYRQGSFALATDFTSRAEALAHVDVLALKSTVSEIMLQCPDGTVLEGYDLSLFFKSKPASGQ